MGIFNWLFGKPANQAVATVKRRTGLFSTDGAAAYGRNAPEALAPWPVPARKPTLDADGAVVATMDANDLEDSLKPMFGNVQAGVPEAQIFWYAAQGFIGYQMCALLSQHWLVAKACAMPAKDAVRNGYDISVDDGVELDPKALAYIKKLDKAFRVKQQLIEFVNMGRVFGIRIVKFVVESEDKDYYKKPFNIDGVKPGSYKGMSQIDPYWCAPELTSESALEPGNQHFYEPEFWRIGSEVIHRSHLIIFTTGTVPDVLKPCYFYGGVSISQRIYERVYAAERTANEAPQLAMTKRLTVMKTDLDEAIADEAKFTERMSWWIENMNNYGVKFVGADDEIQQFDTTLTDLDSLIMTQYQIVAAIAEVPGTKLLGTQPKGFNSTGEFEESSYHEMLESLQENDMTPLVERHHLLVVRSHVMPKFNIAEPFTVDIAWNELDAMTAAEQAGVNLQKAELDNVLLQTGAIDSQDIRNRIIADPDSGYSGLDKDLPPMPELTQPPAPIPPPKPVLPRPKPEAGA